jgi:sulfate adenylyltransferase
MLNRLINQVQENVEVEKFLDQKESLVNYLDSKDFLLKSFSFSNLIMPHGGQLADRIINAPPPESLAKLPKIKINQNQLMDLEQIALGTFSPLEGFLGRDDLESVLDTTRLKNGIIWPIPIVLDVSVKEAEPLAVGSEAALADSDDNPVAILHLEEKYDFDKRELAERLYGTLDEKHPGIRAALSLQPVFLGGKIDFFQRPKRDSQKYELSPRQARQIFREREWSTVVGFHTRNVIHRGHEFIQMRALEQESCDGLLVHPVVGAKKPGDFHTKYIMQSYQKMMDKFYPKNRVVLAAFNTYSRYAGPREALFTALCRKNFGCSHFVVGRDHTGAGKFYEPYASQKIFDLFPDIGIKIIKLQAIYSKTRNTYVASPEEAGADEIIDISGTQARAMLARAEFTPAWFMRPEIAEDIIQAIKNGEEVFVKEN